MELLDRYLRSLQFWLPGEQRHDIIAELSEDIRSEVEEKQAAMGRELTVDEMRALLRRRGSPLRVAESYLPQRYLIGPRLFAIYWMLLRSLLLYFLFPWAIFWLCFTAAVPSYYAHSPALQLLRTLAPLWTLGLYTIVGLTVGFAIVERVEAAGQNGSAWEPGRCRVVRDPNRVPRSSSIAEVVWNGFLLLWWANALRMPASPDLRITSSATITQYFYWPVLLLLVAMVIVAAANLIWPLWTRRRAALRLAVDLAGLVMMLAMVVMWAQGGVFVELEGAKISAEALAKAQQWISVSCVIVLLLMGVSFAARAFQDFRRTLGKQPSLNRAVKLLVGE